VLVCLLPVKGLAAACVASEDACRCCKETSSVEPPTVRRPSCCEQDEPSAPGAAKTAVIAAQGLDLAIDQAVLVHLAEVPAMVERKTEARQPARAPPSARRRLARLSHWLL
jgi:hypothetical protein